MLQFNLSPSAINLYNESQLRFYYKYIAKLEATDKTVDCYGKGGNIVHTCIENHDIKLFDHLWYIENMDDKLGLNHKPLDYEQYYNCAYQGIDICEFWLENEGYELEYEKEIVLPLIKEKYKCTAANGGNRYKIDINVKGIIDAIIYDLFDGNSIRIKDWKTSSKIDTSGNFELQAKHYCYLIYRTEGVIPVSVDYEYLKLGETKMYSFTEQELLEHEEYLKQLAKEIISKGNDIDKYSIGNIESPFNEHFSICKKEKCRREDPSYKTICLQEQEKRSKSNKNN